MYKNNTDKELEIVNEASSELNKYDTESYERANSVIFEESAIPFPGINSGLENVSIIESALTDLAKIAEADVNPMISFFTTISNSNIIDDANIVLTIPNLAEVDKIRPQFLGAEAKNIQLNLEKFMKGSIDERDLVALVDKVSISDMKKNLSKTVLDTTRDLGELARDVRGENVHIDKTVIVNRVIPFFKGFAVNYANLIKEANAVIEGIKASSIHMSQIIAAYNNACTTLDRNKSLWTNKYMYAAVRRFIELRSYASFITARKILNFTHALLQYNNLYNYLIEKYPEGTRILHESVLDGELSLDVNDKEFYDDMVSGASGSIIDVKINSIISRRSNDIADFSRNTSGVNALDTIDATAPKYDKEIYNSIVNIFKSFTSRIADFESAIMAGDQFDDAMNQTGFEGNVALKYNSVISNFATAEPEDFAKFSDVQIDKAVFAYCELTNMSSHIADIRKEAMNASQTLKNIKDNFTNAKTSQNDVSVEVLDEAIKHIDGISSQFRELVVQVAKSAYNRADSLDKDIEEFLMINTSDTVHLPIDAINESTDPSDIMMGTMLAMKQHAQSRVFFERAKEYFGKRRYINEGVRTVYEAETSTTGSTTTSSATSISRSSGSSSNNGESNSEEGG